MRQNKIDKFYWPLLILMALGAVTLGLWGWGTDSNTDRTVPLAQWVMEIITQTLLMFVGEGYSQTFDADNYALRIAKIMALLTLLGAAVRIVIELSINRIEKWRLARQKGHTIICGLGGGGLAFALSERKKGNVVVVVEKELTDAMDVFCSVNKIFLVPGDCRDLGILTMAGLGKASNLILVAGQDSVNLESLMTARGLIDSSKNTADALSIYVEISKQALWQKISDEDLFAASKANVEVYPFNRSTLAAREFVWWHPIYKHAEMLDQNRLHCVFVGYDDYAENLISRIATSCIYKSFGPMRFTVLCGNPDEAETSCLIRFGELAKIVDFTFLSMPINANHLPDELLASIEEKAPISNLFFFAESDETCMQEALAIRAGLIKSGRDNFPIYLRLDRAAGMEDLLVSPKETVHLGSVLTAFGMQRHICDRDMISGFLEKSAIRLHEKYQDHSVKSLSPSEKIIKQESFTGWQQLSETLKVSNRRAVDHLPAKMASAGCIRPPGYGLNVYPTYKMVAGGDEQLNRIATLEQKSWTAGRYVDGWTGGAVRNNARKIHNLLGKTYEELSNQDQEYDRDQVGLLDELVLDRSRSDGNIGRIDHVVSLIGHNLLSETEVQWLRTELTRVILPTLIESTLGQHITLMTSLAPGSDTLLTHAALDYLEKHKVPHRLVIIEGVPEALMVDDFEAKFNQGGHCGVGANDIGTVWSDPDSDSDAARIITADRHAIIEREATEWVIPLFRQDIDFSHQDARRVGYRKAADYVNRHGQTLIAICRQGAVVLPGGTADSLAKRAEIIKAGNLQWNSLVEPATIILDPMSETVKRR